MKANVTAAEKEQQRLDALDHYDVMDTPAEAVFDRITRMVSRMLDVPMSTLTMIDGHRQWYKAREGVSHQESSRRSAICDHVIRQEGPLVIPDTLEDARFRDNENVTNAPHVRFYAGIPLRTPDGQALGTLCAMDTRPRAFAPEQLEMLSDLAALVMQGLELRRLATIDALTGALSRRNFKEEAGRACALARRHRHEFSCIMLDLDRFKAINDAGGHVAGDRVLSATAAICRTVLRKTDIFGRLGGEEFAIALPHTGAASAMRVAEKLRAALAAAPIETPAGPVAVTASFGVVALERAAGEFAFDALLERADAALYLAKAEGRNRCVLWTPPPGAATQGARRRVLKAGRMSFNGGRSSIDCTVRSLSDAGAGMDVLSTAGIPDTFKLQIEADNFSKLCRITEKKERHVEVAFEGE